MKFIILNLFLFAPSAVFAALGNYNSIIIGDQAAGMGGAYTAMTEDASALAWYNPATLAFLKGQSFSAAVGIYKKFDIKYAEDESLEKASLRVNQGFFRALPSSTGSVIRPQGWADGWTAALSIVTPDFESFNGEIKSGSNFKSDLSVTDESLWVGGALAKKVSAKESFGATFYYTARSLSKQVTDTSSAGVDKTIYNEDRNIFQNGLVLSLGWYRVLSEEWQIGINYRPRGIHVAGEASYFDSTIDTSLAAQADPTDLKSVKSKAQIPEKATVGFAWKPEPNWVWAWDVSYYGGLRYTDLDNLQVGEQLIHNPIWNTQMGLQYTWFEIMKFRLGAFTNFSAHPNPKVGRVRGQGDRTDQLGWSANVALKSGDIEYTFGGYYTGGKGRSVQRVNQVYEVVTKQVQVFTMLIGTSYAF